MIQNAPSTPPPSLRSLESLRIIAAVAVVLAHSGFLFVPFLQPFIGGSIFLGSIGVDIFFIISGFVMGISTMRTGYGRAAAFEFFIARILRLFPLYVLCTVLTVVGVHKDFSIEYIFQSILLLPTFDNHTFVDPIVGLGWTLRFEFYFYLLVAIGIAINHKFMLPVVGILFSFIAWLWSGFYYGAPLVLEFVAGFILSFYKTPLIDGVRDRLGAMPLRAGLVMAVVLVLCVSTGKDATFVDHGMYGAVPRLWIAYQDMEVTRVLAWGFPSFLLVYLCLTLEADFKWRLSPLGRYTYGVYLLQVFALSVAMKIKKLDIGPDVLALVVGGAVLSIVSFLSFRYIEAPALSLRRRFRHASKNAVVDAVKN